MYRLALLASALFALGTDCAIAQPSVGKCSLPPGWQAVERRHPHYVVFGEVHGSKESPELVGAVACALAHQGERLLVGIEVASASNPQLQRLWSTSSERFSYRLLTELPYFAERDDGVASVSMVKMLDQLHALSQSGMTVDIVAFNGARDVAQVRRWRDLPGQGPHEAAQAENIAEAAAKRAYDRVLVLAGNFHAQIRPAHWPEATFDPMAVRLARTGSLLSLKQVYPGAAGTFWNCIPKPGVVIAADGTVKDSQSDCGLHGHLPEHEPRASVRIILTRPPGSEAPQYDGEYRFAVVHGSPPARQFLAN
jgi:hypothetical protein